jgi:hypothetical protein
MTDLCRCAANPIAGCGAAITQEDLLCDGCRGARQCPGAVCASMKIDGELRPHFTLLVWSPRITLSSTDAAASGTLSVTT